jgi:eukaryotic-like serine/threonine-protein kinase
MKRLHRQFAGDPEFVAMFLDEARIAARVRHPNVASTLDVVSLESELYLIMDYIQGESVAHLLRALRLREANIPPGIAVSITCEALAGLHAAHDATDERGQPLGIVHRDVSPQNILVGTDGVTRVVDFGVAKAAGRMQTTREGQVKGKAAYMAPEQLRGDVVDRRTDVYSAAVVLWEMLTGERLFKSDTPAGAMTMVLEKPILAPSTLASGVDPAIDEVVLRGLARDPDARFPTARDMAVRLEEIAARESATKIGDWVREVAGPVLDGRAARVARIERLSTDGAQTKMAVPAGSPVPYAEAEAVVASLIATTSEPALRPMGPGTRARRFVWTAAATALVGGSVVGAIALRGPGHPQTVAPPAPLLSEPAASTVPSASSGAVAATGSAATAPLASSAPGPSIAPGPPPRRGASPPSSPTKPPKPANAGCTPPYTVDAQGFHIPKPECM